MSETTGSYVGDTNGLMRFRYAAASGAAQVAIWRCPPERLGEFQLNAMVRLVFDDDGAVVAVEVL